MTALDASALAEALADPRLLEAEQYDEFSRTIIVQCREVSILAKELIYRGWLTPFQVELILAGQASSLFMGSYVLIEPLGQGGMGRVYRARNWKLNRIVAIKVIGDEQAQQPALIARFQREIRALGKVRHPNIVQALDAEFEPGLMFFVMECFAGMDLGRYVRQHGPMAVDEAVHCIIQAADALQHAHEIGLIHRDIKPSNLLLTEPDHTIKLLDLGLSRLEVPINDSVFDEMTRAGAIIGTPDYMSPEQVKDSRGADVRSDLYSLGCTFYFLLAGHAPYEHLPVMVDKLYAQCEDSPTPIDIVRPDVPPVIAAIIRRLMSKRRRDRFQSPAELVICLQEFLGAWASKYSETMVNVPRLVVRRIPPAEDRTQILSESQIGMFSAPMPVRKPNRKWRDRMHPVHLAIAVLLATFGILMMRHLDVGPKPDGERTQPQTPISQPDQTNPDDGEGERAAANKWASELQSHHKMDEHPGEIGEGELVPGAID